MNINNTTLIIILYFATAGAGFTGLQIYAVAAGLIPIGAALTFLLIPLVGAVIIYAALCIYEWKQKYGRRG